MNCWGSVFISTFERFAEHRRKCITPMKSSVIEINNPENRNLSTTEKWAWHSHTSWKSLEQPVTSYYNVLQFGLLLFNYNNPTPKIDFLPAKWLFFQAFAAIHPVRPLLLMIHREGIVFQSFSLIYCIFSGYMLIHKRRWWHFLEIEGKTEAHRNAFLYVVEFVESIFLETGGLDWWFGVWWPGIVAFRFFCVQLKKQTPKFGYVNWKEHMIKKSMDIQLIFSWNKIHTDFTLQHDPNS